MKTIRVAAVSMNGYLGEPERVLASTQEERIREEMIVATLPAVQLAEQRALANYMLRTRRPELFGELTREQVRC